MNSQTGHNEWSGAKGKFNAWFFNTHTRKIAEKYIFGNYWPEFQAEIDRQKKLKITSVLDLGSGSGNFTLPIAKEIDTCKVFALDLSTEMCDYLKKLSIKKNLYQRIHIINKEIFESGLENNSIDWVVSGNVFHELTNPQEVLNEMFRLIRANGSIFIKDFTDWHGYDQGGHGPYSVEQLTELLKNANFININVQVKRHFVIATATKRP